MVTYKTFEPSVTLKAKTRENPKTMWTKHQNGGKTRNAAALGSHMKANQRKMTFLMSTTGNDVRNRRYKLFLKRTSLFCVIKDNIDLSINIIFVRQTWDERTKLT